MRVYSYFAQTTFSYAHNVSRSIGSRINGSVEFAAILPLFEGILVSDVPFLDTLLTTIAASSPAESSRISTMVGFSGMSIILRWLNGGNLGSDAQIAATCPGENILAVFFGFNL